MEIVAAFLAGLVAGGLSCSVTHGALLGATTSRQPTPLRPAVPHSIPTSHATRQASGALTSCDCGAAPSDEGSANVNEVAAATNPNSDSTTPLHAARSRQPPRLALLIPSAAFLTGKLASHALAGAALGAAGSTVTFTPRARAILMLTAGFVIIALALNQLGWLRLPPSWRRRRPQLPEHWLSPAIAGAATILIPCGVTLSVAAIALASGSPVFGAAIMAAFVVGTAPVFTAIGVAFHSAMGAWRGKLAAVVVAVLGLYTANGGLELLGSPFAASSLARNAGLSSHSDSAGVPPPEIRNGRQVVHLRATNDGYAPRDTTIKAGYPTTLIVDSESVRGCVRYFVVPALNREWRLPATGETRIDLGKPAPGYLHLTCSMGMYTAGLTVK